MGAYRYCDCDRNDPVPMSAPTIVEAMTGEYRCPRCHKNHWCDDDHGSGVQQLVERLEALEAKAASSIFVGVDLASGSDITAHAIIDMGEIIDVPEVPGDWRPIATAPKTGEQIELGGPSGYIAPNDWHVETGRWGPHAFPHGCWIDDTGYPITDGFPEPTHWRPCRPMPRGG